MPKYYYYFKKSVKAERYGCVLWCTFLYFVHLSFPKKSQRFGFTVQCSKWRMKCRLIFFLQKKSWNYIFFFSKSIFLRCHNFGNNGRKRILVQENSTSIWQLESIYYSRIWISGTSPLLPFSFTYPEISLLQLRQKMWDQFLFSISITITDQQK